MDHLLQKNYTKTDPLTMSNAKAKDYISNVVAAQQQIFERATKIDTHINPGFADFEVRCVTLFASLQKTFNRCPLPNPVLVPPHGVILVATYCNQKFHFYSSIIRTLSIRL